MKSSTQLADAMFPMSHMYSDSADATASACAHEDACNLEMRHCIESVFDQWQLEDEVHLPTPLQPVVPNSAPPARNSPDPLPVARNSHQCSAPATAVPEAEAVTAQVPQQQEQRSRLKSQSRAKATEKPVGNLRERSRAAQQRYRTKQKDRLAHAESRVAELEEMLRAAQLQHDPAAETMAAQPRPPPALQPGPAAEEWNVKNAGTAPWWLDSAAEQQLAAAVGVDGDLTISAADPVNPLVTTHAALASSPISQLSALWRPYVPTFASCLLEMDGDPSHPAALRLAKLLHEATALVTCVLISRPHELREFWRGWLNEEACGVFDATTEMHESMVQSSCLTPQQESALLELRQAYLTRMGMLQQRRRKLVVSMLGEAAGTGAEAHLSSKLKCSLSATALLKETFKDEQIASILFTNMAYRRIFTPLQSASMQVQAWPACTSVLELSECLARKQVGYCPHAQLVAAAANAAAESPLEKQTESPPHASVPSHQRAP